MTDPYENGSPLFRDTYDFLCGYGVDDTARADFIAAFDYYRSVDEALEASE